MGFNTESLGQTRVFQTVGGRRRGSPFSLLKVMQVFVFLYFVEELLSERSNQNGSDRIQTSA